VLHVDDQQCEIRGRRTEESKPKFVAAEVEIGGYIIASRDSVIDLWSH
jgi:hypothetical protein